MQRFHFNVHDGKAVIDADGTLLPSLAAARTHAIRLAGAILADEAETIELGQDWMIEVTDSRGLILFQMTFLVMASAAGGSR